ncbi:hypothetical protein ACFYT4_06780 [Streptomyces sp. NPDC004609]|uniref:LppU/SCO3897 family protein n=1 Tax=Streptomyces sp. NPDC004609 TaxID=3364704 RepID=UPI0036A0114B
MTFPPPQGQNPPPQGGNPYGNQGPYGQQPPTHPVPQSGYPQQPQPRFGGYPQQPHPPQQQWGAPPPPGPRKSPLKKILLIGTLAIGLIVVGIVAVAASKDEPDRAKIGDCMLNEGTQSKPELKIVDCNRTTAEYKVVDVIKDTSDAAACESKSDLGYWEQHGSGGSSRDFVLCLDQIT